jgi:hypothetical protein
MPSRSLCALLGAVTGWLGACAAVPDPPMPVAPTPTEAAIAPAEAQPIAWSEAGDCRAKLALLGEAMRAGRLGPEERPPFAALLPGTAGGRDWLAPPTVAITADLPLEIHERTDAAKLTEPCLVLIEPARDQRVGRRVIGRDNVRSLYQSGTRSERNPDYDAARLRVRQAEREAKDDGPDILKVGDPMLDLVGLLIGGVVSGFSQGSHERELDEALSELAATPRSRDRPLYRAYEFERITIRAAKEATIPVALLDRATGRLWRAELRRRERRELAILEGLDPRDRDYDEHSAASMTRQDFERWLREPPQLELSAIVTALREAGAAPVDDATVVAALAAEPAAAAPPGRAEALAPLRASALRPGRWAPGVGGRARPVDPDDRIGDEAPAPFIEEQHWGEDLDDPPRDLDAVMALWRRDDPRQSPRLEPEPLRVAIPSAAGRDGALPNEPKIEAARDLRVASVVHLATDARSGSGVYVRPDLVLTSAQLVDGSSVIDVVTFDGTRVLGLVARADPVRDLALVQVQRPGPPVTFYDGPPLAPGRPVEGLALSGPGGAAPIAGRLQRPGSTPSLADPTSTDVAYVAAPTAPADPLAMPGFLGDAVVGIVAGATLDPQSGLRTVGAREILDFLDGSGGALSASQ